MREPIDIIRTVADARWKERQAKYPDKFSGSVRLSYSYSGPLTDIGMSRLKNAIDQIPEVRKNEYEIVVDGDVAITIKRLNEEATDPEAEDRMMREMTKGKRGRLIFESPIRLADLEFKLPELQNLFIKVFRTVGETASKFFGRQSDPEAENVIVTLWAAPDILYDESTPQIVQQAIEASFDAVDLQLTLVVLGSDPEPNFAFGASSQTM